jgi:hypothetical protein
MSVLEAGMRHPGDWSNEELLARLRAHVGNGNKWLGRLLVYGRWT